MLLSNIIYTTSIQAFNFIAIRGLQGREGCKVAGLELVRSVRGQPTKGNVFGEAELQDLKCFVGPKAIAYQYPWFTVGQFSSLGIKHARKPLQADLRVIIPILGKTIVPSRGGISRSVASMGRSWPDYERVQ
jgi:hypothetical protein